MKFRTKIFIAILSVLLFSTITTLFIAIYSIKKAGNADIEQYKSDEIAKVERYLKDFVDIGYQTIKTSHSNALDVKFLTKAYGPQLKNTIDIAESLITEKNLIAEKNPLLLKNAQKNILEILRKIRYGSDGYIWVNDTTRPDPIMLMHPIIPALEGKPLTDPKYNDLADGKNLFTTILDTAEQKGEGFIKYMCPKNFPQNGKEYVSRISYIRSFDPWDLVIGSGGVPVEDAIEFAMKGALDTIKEMRYDNGTGYFWIHEMALPYPRMIMHPTMPELNGTLLNDPSYDTVMKTDDNLFVAMAEICRRHGEGFVEYRWPKPVDNGLTKEVPKLSYVKLYEPLGLIAGTGVYIDDIDEKVAAALKEDPSIDPLEIRSLELDKVKNNLINLVNIVHETLRSTHEQSMSKEFLIKHYGTRLRNIIDIAESILSDHYTLESNGSTTREKAQQSAYDAIQRLYSKNSEYAWVIDTKRPHPTMFVNPEIPTLEGKILDDPRYNNIAEGKNLFHTLLDIAERNDQGFIPYFWPKATSNRYSSEFLPKLSYIKLFKPYSWMIGTGVYISDAIDAAEISSLATLRIMRDNKGEGYFTVFNTSQPYPTMIMNPDLPDLEGSILNDPQYNSVVNTKQNIFQASVDLCIKQGEGAIEFLGPKKQSSGSYLFEKKKIAYVKIYEPLQWIVSSSRDVDNIYDAISKKQQSIANQINLLIRHIVAISSIITALILIISIFFAESITRPIRKLIAEIRSIKLEELSTIAISVHGIKELADFASIFNNMLRSLYSSVEMLKITTSAKEKIEGELSVAHDIQMSIIPKLFPAFPNRPEFDVYATLQPAKAVGGDLYDFFFIDDTQLCFVIGDVSGKGVPASLFMAVTQTLLKAKAEKGIPINEIVTKINKILSIENDMMMFVTYFICILNVETGHLDYCNAGHNPPYIMRSGRKLEKLDEHHGLPLGVLEETSFSMAETVLNPDDFIVLYTDGITEAMNVQYEEYTEERLENMLMVTNPTLPARDILETILNDVKKFTVGAEQSDDITMLVLKYTEKSSEGTV